MVMMRLMAAAAALMLAACTPDVGSRDWCESMDEKPTDEWTLGESSDYARHCWMRGRQE